MNVNSTDLKSGQISSLYTTQSLLWLLFIALGFYIKPVPWNYYETLMWALGNTFFYIIAINVNLHILIPRFMFRQSILPYLTLLLGVSLLLTPFAWMFNMWMVSDYPEMEVRWLTLPQFHFINLIILSALSSLIRVPMDWLKIQSEKKELLTRNIETELQSLKNQINPHFLFNTLNNLYALTLKKSEQAPEVVLKLSDMMRYMLYECNEPMVTIEQEMKYIRNYIELEKLRYSANSEIQLDVDEQLSKYKIAPLLLIPFVENSFKHGMQNTIDQAFIQIQAKLVGNELFFAVHNSKPQSAPDQARPKTVGGVGLVNAKRRLELIYPMRYVLDIQDMPDTFKVDLRIDLNTYSNDTNTHY
ncbi:MAG: histidine kinase [Saprospiraceae bacterium]|nr:histidine kinase [Saprospiraceae bacterium]